MKSKKLNIILIVLLIVAILVANFQSYNHIKNKEVLKYQIAERDKLIAHYEQVYQMADSAYKKKFKEIDSIQHLRNENDTIVYNISSDSIQKLWAERFGNH